MLDFLFHVGDRVRGRPKGAVLWDRGEIGLIWWCQGEFCYDLVTCDGEVVGLVPTLSDELELLDV